MERTIKSLIGNSLEATNGIIGEVKDCYFDDETWTVRYLVVKTGGWLSGREVLIPSVALGDKDWSNKTIPVKLTKEQVQNSPDIDTDKPVSRQQEIKLYDHYAWEGYWVSGFYPGGYLGASIPFPSTDLHERTEPDQDGSVDNVHLRSTEKTTDYHIHASNGEIGHVKDFIIDDQSLQVLFLHVDTHNWLGGKKVLIPVRAVKKIDWPTFEVFLNMTTSEVENSRLFEESEFAIS